MSSSIPTSKIDMSLDDIIKNSRKDKKSIVGRRKFGERRMYNKNNRRNRSESKGESSNQNQSQTQSQDQSHQVPEKRTKLFVSNIQKDVINSELRVRYKKIIMT